MNKMEVKNQQIQTEVVKTVEQYVQVGSTAEQQGVYTTHCILMCYFYVAYLLVIQQIKTCMKRQKYWYYSHATLVSFTLTCFCFIAAGMDKMEVKNQQIQTEVVKTVEQHVQVGSTAEQRGMYATV